MSPFEQIIDLLDREKAAYRVVEHAAEGRSEEVSAVRGTTVSQGAKALVCRVKGIDSPAVLAVLAGDRRADLKRVVASVEGRKGGFAPSELAEQLTGPRCWTSRSPGIRRPSVKPRRCTACCVTR
ncbi:YbaK/EbsC family protein, partial [Streptomyces sp. NPDC005568]|uniref:YbaK/EbsC family protein n=1 Tax=Streptomyces sp. NPDC005568 TaxID=3156887 RepID=UPI0033ABE207